MSKRILEAVREASISIASCLDEPGEVTKKDLEHIQDQITKIENYLTPFYLEELEEIKNQWELHRIIMYDIIKIDRAMTKIKPIVRVPNIVAKNLLDTRYRQRIVKNKKKYNRRRNKNVCDITS